MARRGGGRAASGSPGSAAEDGFIELVDLPDSPKFPGRQTNSGATPSPSYSPRESQVLRSSSTLGPSESSSSEETQKGNKPKRLFLGTDLLGILPLRRAATPPVAGENSPSTSVTASPSRSPGPRSKDSSSYSRSPGTDRRTHDSRVVSASGGRYTVAHKDVSLLERISSRQHKRALRVRKPHEVFVELEEIHADDPNKDPEWEETARWIKFEEDVEEGSGRWGRPHVSALDFHSLADLRHGLETGSILLDVEGDTFPTIAKKIVENMVLIGQLPAESVDPLLTILCKKHRHKITVTLWDKLKSSAREGRLHNIGEEIIHSMHRITSTNHATLHEHDTTGPGERPEDSTAPPSYPHNGGQRDSVVPLMEECPDGRHITFKISESIQSLSSPTELGQAGLSGPSLPTADTSVEIEVVEAALDDKSGSASKGIKGEEATPELHHSSTGSFQEFLRHNRSVVSLMEKIPDEAESLTVMVGQVHFLKEPVGAFVRLHQSHLLGDLTEVPVPIRFIYLLLGPQGALNYHEVGRAMATLMSDARFHEVAYSAVSEDDLLDAIDEFLDDSIVLPPGDWDQDLLLPVMHQRNELQRRKQSKKEEEDKRKEFLDDPLKHSRRPCGGVWFDFVRLIKRYLSDYRDALHWQVLVSILFLFISFIAPAIAFGSLMDEVTNNEIGVVETLMATGACGIVYGLFAVQPLSILAFTGPLLLFEEIVAEFSHNYHLSYLEWRASIGLWLSLIVILFAVSESTKLVRYFSRFSEEIFTGVVALFFTVEASRSIVGIYTRNPLCGINYPCGIANVSNTCMPIDPDEYEFRPEGESVSLPQGFQLCNQPNTALFSTILCISTFIIAVLLKKIRQGRLLSRLARRIVSDFGMFVAIATMVLVAYLLRNMVTVETLEVAPGFQPSNTPLDNSTNATGRPWFINPFNGNISILAGFGALIPASLVGILIFIENQLTVLLVNKPEHKLTKPGGFHFDLLLVGLLTGLCGLLGMPWLCAASIRSVQHIQALSVYSKHNAPGEKPVLKRVYEQRVTNIAVHSLILLSLFAYPILKVIPRSVVLGVFFYLAYSSILGVQLRKRVLLFFVLPNKHPNLLYVRKVRTLKMHLYTLIQLFFVAGLFSLKLSPGAMVYPLVIVLLIPLRWVLAKLIFTHEEMEALNSEEDFPEEHEEGDGDLSEWNTTNVPY